MSKWRANLAFLLPVLAAALLLLAGCGPLVDQDQVSADPAATVTLAPGGTVGQTFVAQHGGLNGIELVLRNPGPAPVAVEARLRTEPAAQNDLAVTAVTLPPGNAPAPVRFAFPAQLDSHAAYRYVYLSSPSGSLDLTAAGGQAYLNGSLHLDGRPAEGQLRFRLTYDPALAARETAAAALDALRLIGAGALIWALPGWAVLSLCLPRARHHSLPALYKLALAAGLGVALYPVFMLWAATLGIRLGAALAWGPPAFALIALLAQYAVERSRAHSPADEHPAIDATPGARWADALLIVALLAIFATRLLPVRALDAPSWGDSVQHAVMAQLMIDQGGLYSNWLPYTPYASLTIQYGFASNTAALQQLLGLDAAQATLLAGQLLNALAVFALYPLAVRIARGNRWAGVAAVIVAGLLSPMPAFYVNWGRYAQLAGQVALPVALWLLWEAGARARPNAGVAIAAALALAGMMLCYYRMPYNYAAFGLAWLIFVAAPLWGRQRRRWLGGLGGLAAVAVLALLLVLPWLSRVADSSLADTVEGGLAAASRIEPVLIQLRQWQTVTEYAPLPLLLAGALALGWAIFRRRWDVVMVGLWALLMAALVAARLLRLPGANLLQTFAVMILLYIPLGLLVGWLIGEIAAGAWTRRAGAGKALAALGLVAIAFGSLSQLGAVKPEFVLVTRPDARAMQWIRANTPEDAVFLVEGFRIYAGQSAVGADAGWWTPLLAGRANTMPPQYALLNEKPVTPGYSRRVVDLVAALETNAPASAAGMAALREMGVTHVYIGQTQGQTGMGVSRLFGPEDFLGDARFDLVYQADRVYVFALVGQ